MSSAFEKRLLVVWLALSAFTLISLWMGSMEARDTAATRSVIASGGIAIALIKTRIVFREFMEVRHAPVFLRRLTDGWLLLTAVSLLGVHLVGTALSMG